MYITHKNKSYDARHGGCFDRGCADSYYGRSRNPHYYVGDTGNTTLITDLTLEDIEAYNAGYEYNEERGNKKNHD